MDHQLPRFTQVEIFCGFDFQKTPENLQGPYTISPQPPLPKQEGFTSIHALRAAKVPHPRYISRDHLHLFPKVTDTLQSIKWLTSLKALLKSRKHVLTSSPPPASWMTIFNVLKRFITNVRLCRKPSLT